MSFLIRKLMSQAVGNSFVMPPHLSDYLQVMSSNTRFDYNCKCMSVNMLLRNKKGYFSGSGETLCTLRSSWSWHCSRYYEDEYKRQDERSFFCNLIS